MVQIVWLYQLYIASALLCVIFLVNNISTDMTYEHTVYMGILKNDYLIHNKHFCKI